MNSRLTIAVLFLLIILVGVVAYVSRQPIPPAHPTKHTNVFTPHPTSVKAFSYAPANGPVLSFKQSGTHWLITSPIKARGQGYTIGDLAGTLADLKWLYRMKIDATGVHSLAATGLDKSHRVGVLTLTDQAGNTSTLDIGGQNAAGRLYVHLDGVDDPYIDVVDADWLSQLTGSASTFRKLGLTDFQTQDIAAITLRTAKRTIRLVPHGSGWLITQPLLVPVNNDNITSWISNLQMLSATKFSDIKAEQAGLKHGPLTITIEFKSPKPPAAATKVIVKKAKVLPAPAPLVIRFGIKTDLTGQSLYADSSYNPGICVIPMATFSQLNEGLSKLRNDHLVSTDVSNAVNIVITRHTGVTHNMPVLLTLTQKNGNWQMATSAGKKITASHTAVTKLLNDLQAVSAKSFVDAPEDQKSFGLASPWMTWRMTLPDHIHPISLAFGNVQKSGLMPVKVGQWPSIYLISADTVKSLEPTLDGLRKEIKKSNVKTAK